MRTIRASEVGSFLYCQRAWWYQRKEVPSENISEMATGTEIHYQHGRSVMMAGCLRTLAVVSLLGAIVSSILYLVSKVL